MTSIISIDNSNFDLNAIMKVDFSYNFEILKKALEALIRVQNFQSKKLIDIEEKYDNKLSK